MHDTTQSFSPPGEFGAVAAAEFPSTDPSEHSPAQPCLFCKSDDEIRFSSAEDADFVREYRRRLSMLNVRVRSDYPIIQEKLRSQSRRLDALEGLVPKIHMQESELRSVARDVRSLKRTVVDLQCMLEQMRRPLAVRVWQWLRSRI